MTMKFAKSSFRFFLITPKLLSIGLENITKNQAFEKIDKINRALAFLLGKVTKDKKKITTAFPYGGISCIYNKGVRAEDFETGC